MTPVLEGKAGRATGEMVDRQVEQGERRGGVRWDEMRV